jgi:hypothetical protein
MLMDSILLSRPKWMLFGNNHTWDVVDRPTHRNVVDSESVFKIKPLSDRSVDKFKARLVSLGFSQIQQQEYDKMFAPVVFFRFIAPSLVHRHC